MFSGFFSRKNNESSKEQKGSKGAEQPDPLAFIDELVQTQKEMNEMILKFKEDRTDRILRHLSEAGATIDDGFKQNTVESLTKGKTAMTNVISLILEEARVAPAILNEHLPIILKHHLKMPTATAALSPGLLSTLHQQYESAFDTYTPESLQRANFIFTSLVDTMIAHRSRR